jgi:hypothetical protein
MEKCVPLLFLRFKKASSHYRNCFNRFWAHYHAYPTAKWISLVESSGFTVVSTRTYGPKYLCLLNDFLVPFSILEFITKKILNRWTLYPRLRRILMLPISSLIAILTRNADCVNNGGLVFLMLTK